MGGSGTALAGHVGSEGASPPIFAIFAAGFLFISLCPTIALGRKVAALEEELVKISQTRKTGNASSILRRSLVSIARGCLSVRSSRPGNRLIAQINLPAAAA